MNSSMTLLGPILLVGPQVCEHAVSEDGARLAAGQAQRAVLMAGGLHGLGHPVLGADLLVEPTHGLQPPRRQRRAVEPGRHRVVGQLRAVEHVGAVDLGSARRAVRAHYHVHYDGQALLVLVERG